MLKLKVTARAILVLGALAFNGCDDGGSGGGSTPVTFDSADTTGDVVLITVGSQTVKVIYANNRENIIFPFSPLFATPVDNEKATLTKKFFMSETQVTNALMQEVLQWAYNNQKFSATVEDHNGLDTTTVKHGGQQLLDLDDSDIKISYSEGSFMVDSGYEDHPTICITWYGSIMFCNWLTEMQDGNTDNIVYTDIDTTWEDTETVENADRTGYRLPSNEEWEYAARFIGTTTPSTGDLAMEYIALDHGGHADLTAGYYWTPCDYTSGATSDYDNEAESRAAAWYSGDPLMGGDKLMPVAKKEANHLGLYDMSGNVLEWCFTPRGSLRVCRGGGWYNSSGFLQVGYWVSDEPFNDFNITGFRFVRTQ